MLFGADGLLAGGPVIGVRDIEAFVDDIVAEIEAAPRSCRPRRAHDHGHDHGHGHGHDHGHGQGHGEQVEASERSGA